MSDLVVYILDIIASRALWKQFAQDKEYSTSSEMILHCIEVH